MNKRLLQINLTIGVVLSFFLSIKGSMNNGWFSCMNLLLTDIKRCSFLSWILQVVILLAVFTLILTGIEYGVKYLFKSTRDKIKAKKEKAPAEASKEEAKAEETKPEKKVIKI